LDGDSRSGVLEVATRRASLGGRIDTCHNLSGSKVTTTDAPLLSSLCEKSGTSLGGYKFPGTLIEREEHIGISGLDTCRSLSFQVLSRSGVHRFVDDWQSLKCASYPLQS